MNSQIILIAAASLAALGSAVGALALTWAVKARRATRDTIAVAIQMEHEMAQMSRDLDAATERTNNYARRIAWLESRHGTAALAEVEQTAVAVEAHHDHNSKKKPSITERRHRVLSLARRGVDTQVIATTLGVPHGEVDLIINLSRVA